ncbi:ABC transporter substrate-binding protein [Feifania hominis]|uniref:ABC transporter substrate-binding protein n=1 Tax=Feifania hominis TaxID=2763660 RepID=A0A926DCG7_9FIRM|nr:ABC transporter substrate-binding protein [Feifania hominis]
MKRLFAFVLALVMAVSFAACSDQSPGAQNPEGPTSSGDGASTEPINIGVLCTLDGATGLGAKAAVELYFEQNAQKLAGRPVKVYFENTTSDPNIAIEKLVKCVDEYGCQLIIGPLSGSEGTAVKEYAEFYLDDTTIIVGSSGSTQITFDTPENLFRVCATGAQSGFSLGHYAYEELGYRKILTVASDYDFTFSQVAGFLYGFVAAGGEVVDRIWFTKGTTDYSSTLAAISQYKDVDAIFCGIGASDSMYFVRQYVEYGMKIPLMGGSNFTDVSCITSDIADYYDGILTSSYYADDLGTEEYESFVKAYADYYGQDPSSFACDFYMACEIAAKALEEVDGNIEDREAFRAALANVNYQSPRGEFKLDEDHQAICTIFITEVTKNEAGVYRNKVIREYKDVSQYGDFDPDWYAAQPDPDRTNPTVESIKNAEYTK